MSDIEREPATEHADLYERHEADPSKWEKADAVTDRPNDLVEGQVRNTTLAERAAAAKKSAKKVDDDDAENKAVTSASTKAKRPARKSK